MARETPNSARRRTRGGLRARLTVIICVALCCSGQVVFEVAETLEYRVKAAYLLNFTKFVEWAPPDAHSPASPIAICIVGEDPFGPVLDRMVEGESVGKRRITVRHLAKPEESGCNLAFIGRSEKEARKILASFPAGVLTVGEGDEFLTEGGMIAFVIDNRRVRFDVNQTAVRGAGLKLSSRLLTVARSVRG
jgi:hypothetical protein